MWLQLCSTCRNHFSSVESEFRSNCYSHENRQCLCSSPYRHSGWCLTVDFSDLRSAHNRSWLTQHELWWKLWKKPKDNGLSWFDFHTSGKLTSCWLHRGIFWHFCCVCSEKQKEKNLDFENGQYNRNGWLGVIKHQATYYSPLSSRLTALACDSKCVPRFL